MYLGIRMNFCNNFGSNVSNNPLTTLPFIVADYSVGHWIVHTLCKEWWIPANPSWMMYINDIVQKKLGLPEVCLWSFIVGGM